MSTSTEDLPGTTDSLPPDPSLLRQKLIAQSLKDKIPAATLDPTSGAYDNLDSAAEEFYKNLGEHDPKTENAGVLYVDSSGKYRMSIPTVQHDEGFKLRIPATPEEKLAGIFHTHPGTDQTAQWFSPNDIDVAGQLKVPSYVYFENNHEMRKYVPGVTKTEMHNIDYKRQTVSRGDLIEQKALVAALRDKDGA
jgi:proteasome lid subunit RPN8/RPN11